MLTIKKSVEAAAADTHRRRVKRSRSPCHCCPHSAQEQRNKEKRFESHDGGVCALLSPLLSFCVDLIGISTERCKAKRVPRWGKDVT